MACTLYLTSRRRLCITPTCAAKGSEQNDQIEMRQFDEAQLVRFQVSFSGGSPPRFSKVNSPVTTERMLRVGALTDDATLPPLPLGMYRIGPMPNHLKADSTVHSQP